MNKNIQNLTDKKFTNYILNCKKYVLVDFWANWCAPCRSLSINLKKIRNEYIDNLEIVKVDIEKNSNTALKYSIQSIPTLILFKNNKVLKIKTGFLSIEDLKIFLNKYIK